MDTAELYTLVSDLQIQLENLKDTVRSLESRIEELERQADDN